MSGPPSYDQDLLSRLNALKKSSISLDSSKSSPFLPSSSREATPESSLSDRLRSLRNNSASPSPFPATTSKPPAQPESVSRASEESTDPLQGPKSLDLDDKTLDELLADLGGGEGEWDLKPEDPDEVQKMLKDAKKALKMQSMFVCDKPGPSGGRELWEWKQAADAEERRKQGKKPRSADELREALDFGYDESVDGDKDEGDGAGDEDVKSIGGKDEKTQMDEEAEEIVRRMLDEVSLEKEQGLDEPEQAKDDYNDRKEGSFSLPSAPTKLPELAPSSNLEPEPDSFEKSIAARMAALKNSSASNSLGLPSAPTFKPEDKPVKGVQKKFTDEEIDSWCIICNDDATVQCMGCDGDLYCANCWKEGHMGPDVGLEEKLHKWRKFVKPR